MRGTAVDRPGNPEWDTHRVLTIPNVLSAIRLLGVPAFGWLILADQDLFAVILLIVFGATDWLDGYLARTLRQRSPLGAALDPIADRLYILTAVVALAIRGIIPWWLLGVLAARDLMLVCLLPSLRRSGLWAVPVNVWGKAATMLLLMAFPLILVGSSQSLGWTWAHWTGWLLSVVGAGLHWAAGFLYVGETVRLSRERRGMTA